LEANTQKRGQAIMGPTCWCGLQRQVDWKRSPTRSGLIFTVPVSLFELHGPDAYAARVLSRGYDAARVLVVGYRGTSSQRSTHGPILDEVTGADHPPRRDPSSHGTSRDPRPRRRKIASCAIVSPRIRMVLFTLVRQRSACASAWRAGHASDEERFDIDPDGSERAIVWATDVTVLRIAVAGTKCAHQNCMSLSSR
jgi:hypothetical protein